MTIRDLINELQPYDPDMTVVVSEYDEIAGGVYYYSPHARIEKLRTNDGVVNGPTRNRPANSFVMVIST